MYDSEIFGTINVIEGTIQNVICKSQGNPNPDSYRWTKDTDIQSFTNTLTLNPAQKQDKGEYSCSVNNTMVPSRGDPKTGSNSSTVKMNVLCMYFRFYHSILK